jgi:hypothetical protein
MKKAVVIQPDGKWEYVEFTNDTFLSVFQKAVDGLVEPVDVRQGVTMWVNEEYLFRNDFEPNIVGTAMFEEATGGTQVVLGAIAITGGQDNEGYSDGLDGEALATITKIAEFHETALSKLKK